MKYGLKFLSSKRIENSYTFNDLQLILALQEDPLQSYSTLAEKLDKSVKTISRWVSRLESNNLFNPVRARITWSLLNFDTLTVIATVNNYKNIQLLEKFCNDHPYTIYRGRLIGAVNGLFMQFLVPKGTKEYYDDIFSIFKDKNKIKNFTSFITKEKSISTKFNLNYWNNEKLKWNFDWKEWDSQIKSIEITNNFNNELPKFDPKIFDKLDVIDVCILRLLNENAKIKLKEIESGILKLINATESIQRISERVKYLKQHFIYDYRLNLNAKVLNIYNTLLIHVYCNESFTQKIKNQLNVNPPPYSGYFSVTDDGFIWYLRMPSTDLSDFSVMLWNSEVEKYDISLVDYSTSEQYAFWEQNYDTINKSWKNSKEHIVKNPLRNAGIIPIGPKNS